jgi:hypothetical protein
MSRPNEGRDLSYRRLSSPMEFGEQVLSAPVVARTYEETAEASMTCVAEAVSMTRSRRRPAVSNRLPYCFAKK